MVYDAIQNSNGFYINNTTQKYRSKINVPFRIRPDAGEKASSYYRLEELFLKQSKDIGLLSLRGHTLTKGIRVSMYNAMPV